MIFVSFVCLGNICRSPMAEIIFNKMVKDGGYESTFKVSSFATSDEEEGNGIYPPVKRLLEGKGYTANHVSKQLSKSDVTNSDYVFVMDGQNLFDVLRATNGAYSEKVYKLGSFLAPQKDIDDPWYTRDFERCYKEIYCACKNLLIFLVKKHAATVVYDKYS